MAKDMDQVHMQTLKYEPLKIVSLLANMQIKGIKVYCKTNNSNVKTKQVKHETQKFSKTSIILQRKIQHFHHLSSSKVLNTQNSLLNLHQVLEYYSTPALQQCLDGCPINQLKRRSTTHRMTS